MVKLPESIIKASAKVADNLEVNYSPTNIFVTVVVPPGQEDNVASIVTEALKPYAGYLRSSSTEDASAILEMTTATAALTVKKSTEST